MAAKVSPIPGTLPEEETPSNAPQPPSRDDLKKDLHDDDDKLEVKADENIFSEDPLSDEGLSLEPSTWEIALLVGVNTENGYLFSFFQTVIAASFFVVTVFFQFIFVLAMVSAMSSSPINTETEKGVLEQRLLTNHHWDNINLREIATRSSDLCSGTVFNSLNSYYADVSEYLDPSAVITGLAIPGKYVCGVAIFIWILSMTTEVRRICELSLAILNLSRRTDQKSPEAYVNDQEDVYMIQRKSVTNKVCLLIFVMGPRLAIAAVLLVYGCIYLANTLAVSDMILNACALEIVKDIDEYLFAATMSHSMRELVEGTRLTYKSTPKTSPTHQVEEVGSVCLRIVFITTTFLIAWFGPLASFEASVEDFNAWVCDYDLEFTWMEHPVVGLPFFASLSSSDLNSTDPSDAEMLTCYYKAHTWLLETRAGFTAHPLSEMSSGNSTLEDIILGQDPACARRGGDDNQAKCPNLSVGGMLSLSGMSASDIYDSELCSDYDYHLQALSDTCHSDQYVGTIFYNEDGSQRTRCAEMADVCNCPETPSEGESCEEEQYRPTMQKYQVGFIWIQRIAKVCPGTCGLCTFVDPDAAPQASTTGGLASSPTDSSSSNSSSTGSDTSSSDTSSSETTGVEGTDGNGTSNETQDAGSAGPSGGPVRRLAMAEGNLPSTHILVKQTRRLKRQLRQAEDRTYQLERALQMFEERLAALEQQRFNNGNSNSADDH